MSKELTAPEHDSLELLSFKYQNQRLEFVSSQNDWLGEAKWEEERERKQELEQDSQVERSRFAQHRR